jgi:CRP-like cAMP-binding protein
MVLFKGLSEANLQAMIKRMKVKSFKDGDTIVEQGTIGTTMYFIDLGGARAIVGDTVAQTLASGMQLFVCVFA